jgi:hypothetical protein
MDKFQYFWFLRYGLLVSLAIRLVSLVTLVLCSTTLKCSWVKSMANTRASFTKMGFEDLERILREPAGATVPDLLTTPTQTALSDLRQTPDNCQFA